MCSTLLMVLCFSPSGQKQCGGRFNEGFQEGIAPERPDFGRGEDKYAARQFADCTFNAGSERTEQSAAREDVVFSRRSVDPYGLHVDSILSETGASDAQTFKGY